MRRMYSGNPRGWLLLIDLHNPKKGAWFKAFRCYRGDMLVWPDEYKPRIWSIDYLGAIPCE